MIAGLSKAVTLYLAPLLALTAMILSLFAFLAPTLLLHDQVSLLVVSPSTTLSQPGPSRSVDGPSVFLGMLGMLFPPQNSSQALHQFQAHVLGQTTRPAPFVYHPPSLLSMVRIDLVA